MKMLPLGETRVYLADGRVVRGEESPTLVYRREFMPAN